MDGHIKLYKKGTKNNYFCTMLIIQLKPSDIYYIKDKGKLHERNKTN